MQTEVKKNALSCDWQRLEAIFKEKGLKQSIVSTQLGYGHAYISNLKMSNREIPKTLMLLLKQMYDIDYEDYKPVVQPKKANIDDKLLSEMTDKELYKLVYGAVYRAVKKAWSE